MLVNGGCQRSIELGWCKSGGFNVAPLVVANLGQLRLSYKLGFLQGSCATSWVSSKELIL